MRFRRDFLRFVMQEMNRWKFYTVTWCLRILFLLWTYLFALFIVTFISWWTNKLTIPIERQFSKFSLNIFLKFRHIPLVSLILISYSFDSTSGYHFTNFTADSRSQFILHNKFFIWKFTLLCLQINIKPFLTILTWSHSIRLIFGHPW